MRSSAPTCLGRKTQKRRLMVWCLDRQILLRRFRRRIHRDGQVMGNRNLKRTKVMMNRSTIILRGRALRAFRPGAVLLLCATIGTVVVGCHSAKTEKKKDEFFTSGSRQADQRASQRMAKEEQLTGSGEGWGEKGAKKAKPAEEGGKPAQAENKMTLYDRLGGDQHLTAIV